jgi:hypothetical protein
MGIFNTTKINFSALAPTEWPEIGSFIFGFDVADDIFKKIDSNGVITTIGGSGGGTSVWSAGTGNSSAVLSGSSNIASGDYSVAEGNENIASGQYSHAEGSNTTTTGSTAHAEGEYTTASGDRSHAEGYETTAIGNNSHAEGRGTESLGTSSHAEGNRTTASGQFSHSEGDRTTALGNNSHSEGYYSIASGDNSFAGGSGTTAMTQSSFAIGVGSIASASEYINIQTPITIISACTITLSDPQYSQPAVVFSGNVLSEWGGYIGDFCSEFLLDNTSGTTQLINVGCNYYDYYYDIGTDSTYIVDTSISSSTYTTISGDSFYYVNTYFSRPAFALGTNVSALGINSHAEGGNNTAARTSTHAEGGYNYAGGNGFRAATAVVNGLITIDSSYGDVTSAFTINNLCVVLDRAFGNVFGFSESTISGVSYSSNTFIQLNNTALNNAGGCYILNLYNINDSSANIVFGDYSHAEGYYTRALGEGSHVEGYSNIASGDASHAEGSGTKAIGDAAHAEGAYTIASGNYSHAEGQGVEATGFTSHAEGYYTKAIGNYSHSGGDTTVANGLNSFVHGHTSTVNGNNSIVLGENIIGDANNTTYVETIALVTVRDYANDAAADADATLASGGLYTITGSRAVYRKP